MLHTTESIIFFRANRHSLLTDICSGQRTRRVFLHEFLPSFRLGNFKAQLFLCKRMLEFQKPRMQRKPSKRIRFGAIIFVARKRIAFACQMRANLILSSRIQIQFEQSVILSAPNNLVIRNRANSFKTFPLLWNERQIIRIVGKRP